MMQEGQLFSTAGDRLENFFGNKAIIGGVLPEAGTVLDDFHFADGDLVIR